MTPKSLFSIILKIFGLFLLRETLATLIQLIATIAALFQPQGYNENIPASETVFNIAIIGFIVFIYAFIIYQLLFNTAKLVILLKLDQGFTEEKFSFNFSRSWLLTVVVIIVGGVILSGEIPNFCRIIFSIIQERRLTHGMTKPNYSYIIFSLVKIVIGFLLIGERRRIVDMMEKKEYLSDEIKRT